MTENAGNIYPYSSGDRIGDDRNTYFYSIYHGKEFFGAWKSKREQQLHSVSSCQVEELFEEPQLSLDSITSTLTGREEIAVDDLLNTLYSNLTKQTKDDACLKLVNRLVKRFEITKRIHESCYGERLRTRETEKYRNITLYLKGAVVFSETYQQTKKLSYLNAFLKSMDSIGSCISELSDTEKGYTKALVALEQSYILDLANKLDLELL